MPARCLPGRCAEWQCSRWEAPSPDRRQTAAVETLRTRFGCLVRLTIGEQQFVTVSGTVTLAEPVRVQWLLASPAKPEAVQWEQLLSRSDHYQWMQDGEAVYASLSLRPSGGWRAE